MGNYVIFLDKQDKPLDYQAVEKALASIGIKAGGWKKLSERDDAYFDGRLCEECRDDDEEEDEDDEDDEDEDEGEEGKDELSPLQRKMREIRLKNQTDWNASDDDFGFEYDKISGFTDDSHILFLAPDIPVDRRVTKQTRFYYEPDKWHPLLHLSHWCYDVNTISQALSKVGAIADGLPPNLYWKGNEGILGIGFYRNTAQIIIAPRVEAEGRRKTLNLIKAGNYQVKNNEL